MKMKDNLSKEQRKALKKIYQINSNTKVYLFDKGSGFIVSSEGDAMKKTEDQLKKAKDVDEDLLHP